MARKRLYSLDDFANYCIQQNLFSYDSSDHNNVPIVVQVDGFFDVKESVQHQGLMEVVLKVCHTLLNRNKSYISEDNMRKAMPSLKYRPILGAIHQLDDGTWHFHGHDMEVEKDDAGNEVVTYIEQPIGGFTSDEPYLQYDESMDKTYVIANGVIYDEYTKAGDIIRDNNGQVKVSCELEIDKFSFNAKGGYLEIEDFTFRGCTCLGKEKNGKDIGEGMLGSKLSIGDFSESNSLFGEKTQEQLLDMMNSLKVAIDKFNNTDKTQEGGNEQLTKFEELLQQYNKSESDITFDYSNMSDDELVANFKELFDAESDGEFANKEEVDAQKENFEEQPTSTTENEVMTISFELSHEDVRFGLYQLLRTVSDEDNDYFYITNVYDDHFVYRSWDTDKIYGQSYTKEEDNVQFNGDRYELFEEILTESEKEILDAMRANYAELQSTVNEYKNAELNKIRESVFSEESYQEFIESDEFVDLKSHMSEYSVEELRDKCDIAFAKLVKAKGSFSAIGTNEGNVVEKRTIAFAIEEASEKGYEPYGNIFNKQ